MNVDEVVYKILSRTERPASPNDSILRDQLDEKSAKAHRLDWLPMEDAVRVACVILYHQGVPV